MPLYLGMPGAWASGFSLPFVPEYFTRLWIFRYEVTEGSDDGKCPLRLSAMKVTAASRKSQIWVFRHFHLAAPALRPLVPSVLLASKNFPGREKPSGFDQREINF